MPQSKTYFRRCENCGYETSTSGGWCRHIKTTKHLLHIKELEKKNSLLVEENKELKMKNLEQEVELLNARLGNVTINNNTTNNIIDASNNIQINIFTPNEKANNLNDIVIPTLLELAEKEMLPSKAIQQIIMGMEEKMRPILYHNSSLYVKQDTWKKDDEAQQELTTFCNKQFDIMNADYCDMEISQDDKVYHRCMEYLHVHTLDNDSVTHKLKTKLIQK
tara:strand:- start:24 stop:683 length:660 start_codon:yes stop_codon:yes gene_type:complete